MSLLLGDLKNSVKSNAISNPRWKISLYNTLHYLLCKSIIISATIHVYTWEGRLVESYLFTSIMLFILFVAKPRLIFVSVSNANAFWFVLLLLRMYLLKILDKSHNLTNYNNYPIWQMSWHLSTNIWPSSAIRY